MNGSIFYKGPSRLDGFPIVAAVTGLARASKNGKTGDLLQTWIMRADVDPVRAVKTGADASICGDCPKRHHIGGDCYVKYWQAPLTVWLASNRDAYLVWSADLAERARGRLLRLGAYGDPVAVPYEAWRPLLAVASATVGYTHQWARCDLRWRAHLMASVDSPEEREEAQRWGWRTFRVKEHGAPLLSGEVACPASAEAGKRRTCETCRACSGSLDSPRAATIAIVEHGRRAPRIPLPMMGG